MLQRQVASRLDIDTPMLSKIERGERSAKREQVLLLAELFNFSSAELLSIWLAEKVFDVVKGEEVALKAVSIVEKELKNIRKG